MPFNWIQVHMDDVLARMQVHKVRVQRLASQLTLAVRNRPNACSGTYFYLPGAWERQSHLCIIDKACVVQYNTAV
jgi:hypothetical protein